MALRPGNCKKGTQCNMLLFCCNQNQFLSKMHSSFWGLMCLTFNSVSSSVITWFVRCRRRSNEFLFFLVRMQYPIVKMYTITRFIPIFHSYFGFKNDISYLLK